MNTLLENKKNQLQQASDFECWYLVKHTTDFGNLCYLVSILEDYIQHSVAGVNIETHIKNNIARINASKSLNLSDNYRALRVAAFFGLIQMTSSSYSNANITPTFNEIKARCNGEFERTDLYEDIICRQIEKMYISSSIDEGSTGVRKNYKLYPVMLLYKVLLELGRSTGNYYISTAEYRYFVATTEKFEDFVKTLTLINLLREEGNAAVQIFEQFRAKFDNRMNMALQKVRTLIVDDQGIKINPDYIKEVAEKVYRFEENPNIFVADNYIRFLCSTKSLIELETCNNGDEENDIEKYQNFKKLVGWFINQLNINNGLKDGLKTSGQGYKEGSAIRENYKLWRDYGDFTLDCNIVSGYQSTSSKVNYINKTETGINIRPKFNRETKEISYLYIDVYGIEIDDSISNEICSIFEKEYTLENLALFDDQEPNDLLKELFDDFSKVIDYFTQVEEKENIDYDTCDRKKDGKNVILYGVPGAGKSWTIDHEYMDEETTMKKVVFHPDYTYSDFVGQILPKKVNDSISYDFVPGPFTKIMKDAYRNPDRKFILAIEEINRGNAPAIFGDIFQLLDRDENGRSSYEIVNADIARIVYSDENHVVCIPSNLSILCTMNTSDQNVFTLDTAFQRRWNMRLIENSFRKDSDEEKKFAEHPILDSDIKWESFCSAINAQILEKNQNMTSSEDKRLGTHFVNLDDLNYYDEESASTDTEKLKIRLKNRRFPEKVIKYLWDDAFKFYRDEIFKAELNSLEKVIKVFTEKKKNDRFEIFKDNIRAAIFDENSKQ